MPNQVNPPPFEFRLRGFVWNRRAVKRMKFDRFLHIFWRTIRCPRLTIRFTAPAAPTVHSPWSFEGDDWGTTEGPAAPSTDGRSDPDLDPDPDPDPTKPGHGPGPGRATTFIEVGKVNKHIWLPAVCTGIHRF